MSRIRVAILDDAPYASWAGSVHASNATFHRFAAALLDVRDGAGGTVVAELVLAAPVRPAPTAPITLPVDPRIRIVATEPFDGIAGYLRRWPLLVVRNAPRLRSAFAGVDVVLLRLPASNGLLGAVAAAARGVPRVAFVVGSVSDVVAGQARSGLGGRAARLVGRGYDAATRLASIGAATVVVGDDPAGEGIIASLVLPDEMRDPAGAPWPAVTGRLRLAYAGRLADGKGLDTLLAVVGSLTRPAGSNPPLDVRLDLVGDGPAAATLAARAAQLGIADRVSFTGYLADREAYLGALERADLFLSASPAEGFPKAVLDAMAAGLPVVAVPAGRLADLDGGDAIEHGAPFRSVPAGDPDAIADAIRALLDDPERARRLRAAGTAFVRRHTMPAEAARLAAVLARQAATRRRRGPRVSLR